MEYMPGLLENDEIYLRALEPEDLDWLYGLENDSALWDVSAGCTPFSRYALRRYIAAQPQDIYQCGELRLAACLKSDNSPIGVCDLTAFSPVDARAEVGLTLLSSQRGKGYGQVLLQILESYAQNYLHLHQLFAYVSQQYNQRSRKLFESMAYEEVAILPDWLFRRGEFENISVFRKILPKVCP